MMPTSNFAFGTYNTVYMPPAHMDTDGCEALSAHWANFRAFSENLDLSQYVTDLAHICAKYI